MSEANNDIDLDSDDVADGNAFDPAKKKEKEKAEFNLKKQNIAKVFGSGWGLVSLIVIAVAFVFFLVFGYMSLSRPAPKAPERNANGAVLAVPSGVADNVASNEREAQERREANNVRAKEEAAKGGMFIAPPVVVGELKEDADKPHGANDLSASKEKDQRGGSDVAADRAKAERERSTGQTAGAAPAPVTADGLSPEDRQRIAQDVRRQVLLALGRPESAKDGEPRRSFETAQFTLPDRVAAKAAAAQASAVAVAAATAAAPANPNVNKRLFISAGETSYCQIEFVLNSDSPRNEAYANCLSGKANGARLIGKYDVKENAGDGLIATTFSLMSFPGKPAIAINAVALDEKTGDVGMADSRESHTLAKYGGLTIASFLRGMGQAAAIVTGTTMTQSSGVQSTTTTIVPPISTQRQVQIALGQSGASLADSIQKNSESIKQTVKVFPKAVIVKFSQDVFEDK